MVQISKNIYWHGYKHWSLRSFHGHELSTHRASTYNSYSVRDAKTVIVDTVWDPFKEEYVGRIGREVGFGNVDMVVINHIEPDHGGSLGLLMEKLPAGTPIYCTANCERAIRRYFHNPDWRIVAVKTGDSVNIGEYDLVFVEMRMLHWPDSMLTYVRGAGVAFSNDAFGQHYCTSGYFNDCVDESALYQEALKYFANILAPFAPLITKKAAEIEGMGLAIDVIAPSHGVIWRKDATQIIRKYAEWADSYSDGSVVVTYDCFYKATEQMAEAIAGGLESKGVPYKLFHCAATDMSDLITDVFCASGVVIGSSTINNTVHRTTASLLDEIKGHKLCRKVAASFGSYGWSGESPKIIAEGLSNSGFEIIGEPMRVLFAPSEEDLAACAELGAQVADAVLARCSKQEE
jgi:flavorubredoxin